MLQEFRPTAEASREAAFLKSFTTETDNTFGRDKATERPVVPV